MTADWHVYVVGAAALFGLVMLLVTEFKIRRP